MTKIDEFTTIRISNSLKKKLDEITPKNSSYDEILKNILYSYSAIKKVEKDFLTALKQKNYVDFDSLK